MVLSGVYSLPFLHESIVGAPEILVEEAEQVFTFISVPKLGMTLPIGPVILPALLPPPPPPLPLLLTNPGNAPVFPLFPPPLFGFLSCLCVLRCRWSFPVWEKALPHTSQRKGFSPVWVLRWICSVSRRANLWIHRSHGYGF